jgi:ParB family chromosome partitioning protein
MEILLEKLRAYCRFLELEDSLSCWESRQSEQLIHLATLQENLEKKQQELAQKVIALGLSVRQTELLSKNMERPVKEKPPQQLRIDYIGECEKQLSKHLGRNVKIVNGKRKGRFELEFYGSEDLQILLDALMKLNK